MKGERLFFLVVFVILIMVRSLVLLVIFIVLWIVILGKYVLYLLLFRFMSGFNIFLNLRDLCIGVDNVKWVSKMGK